MISIFVMANQGQEPGNQAILQTPAPTVRSSPPNLLGKRKSNDSNYFQGRKLLTPKALAYDP
jgi:hypothetical protein